MHEWSYWMNKSEYALGVFFSFIFFSRFFVCFFFFHSIWPMLLLSIFFEKRWNNNPIHFIYELYFWELILFTFFPFFRIRLWMKRRSTRIDVPDYFSSRSIKRKPNECRFWLDSHTSFSFPSQIDMASSNGRRSFFFYFGKERNEENKNDSHSLGIHFTCFFFLFSRVI